MKSEKIFFLIQMTNLKKVKMNEIKHYFLRKFFTGINFSIVIQMNSNS
jgi:hypothetical protein